MSVCDVRSWSCSTLTESGAAGLLEPHPRWTAISKQRKTQQTVSFWERPAAGDGDPLKTLRISGPLKTFKNSDVFHRISSAQWGPVQHIEWHQKGKEREGGEGGQILQVWENFTVLLLPSSSSFFRFFPFSFSPSPSSCWSVRERKRKQQRGFRTTGRGTPHISQQVRCLCFLYDKVHFEYLCIQLN